MEDSPVQPHPDEFERLLDRDDQGRTGPRLGGRPAGEVSNFIHGKVFEGDMIRASLPYGDLVVEDAETPLLLVSAGIGCTPILVAQLPSARMHHWYEQLGARTANETDHEGFIDLAEVVPPRRASVGSGRGGGMH